MGFRVFTSQEGSPCRVLADLTIVHPSEGQGLGYFLCPEKKRTREGNSVAEPRGVGLAGLGPCLYLPTAYASPLNLTALPTPRR